MSERGNKREQEVGRGGEGGGERRRGLSARQQPAGCFCVPRPRIENYREAQDSGKWAESLVGQVWTSSAVCLRGTC